MVYIHKEVEVAPAKEREMASGRYKQHVKIVNTCMQQYYWKLVVLRLSPSAHSVMIPSRSRSWGVYGFVPYLFCIVYSRIHGYDNKLIGTEKKRLTSCAKHVFERRHGIRLHKRDVVCSQGGTWCICERETWYIHREGRGTFAKERDVVRSWHGNNVHCNPFTVLSLFFNHTTCVKWCTRQQGRASLTLSSTR